MLRLVGYLEWWSDDGPAHCVGACHAGTEPCRHGNLTEHSTKRRSRQPATRCHTLACPALSCNSRPPVESSRSDSLRTARRTPGRGHRPLLLRTTHRNSWRPRREQTRTTPPMSPITRKTLHVPAPAWPRPMRRATAGASDHHDDRPDRRYSTRTRPGMTSSLPLAARVCVAGWPDRYAVSSPFRKSSKQIVRPALVVDMGLTGTVTTPPVHPEPRSPRVMTCPCASTSTVTLGPR